MSESSRREFLAGMAAMTVVSAASRFAHCPNPLRHSAFP